MKDYSHLLPKNPRYNSPFIRSTERVLDDSIFPVRIHGVLVSYNYDNNRFYLHTDNEDQTTLRTFAATQKNWKNVVNACREIQKKKRHLEANPQVGHNLKGNNP